MDSQILFTINYIIVGIAVIVLFLIIRNIYINGRKVNKKKPEVRERYSRMVLKHTESDKRFKAFLESRSGKYTVIGIIAFIIIALLIILGKLFKLNPDHYMVILTFIAIVITGFTFYRNQKFFQKQQFESTFFNMMKQLEDIVSKLSIEDIITIKEKSSTTNSGGITYTDKIVIHSFTGRNAFRYLFKYYNIAITDKIINEKLMSLNIPISPESRADLKDVRNKTTQNYSNNFKFIGVKSVLNELGIKGYEGCSAVYRLDHYFRYLYRIMRFVDEANFLDRNSSDKTIRYKYMGILRATLSPYELVLLFYNDLSKYGNEKVKPLIENYSFFKSLKKELLANTKIDYELNHITDTFDNDYNRYQTDVKGDKTKYYISAFKKDI